MGGSQRRGRRGAGGSPCSLSIAVGCAVCFVFVLHLTAAAAKSAAAASCVRICMCNGVCVFAVLVCMLVLCDNAIGRERRTPTSTSALTAGVQKSKIVTNSIYCIYSALSVHKCRNSMKKGRGEM